jgi:phage-related protein
MQFGLVPFGQYLYNHGYTTLLSYSTDLAVFEGFSISDGTFMIVEKMVHNEPTREVIGGAVARDHGMYTVADYYREKTIEFQGLVRNTSASGLNAYLDTIRGALRTREGNLDITESGVVKRYVATLTNTDSIFSNRESYHITMCPFSLVFSCRVPFGCDRNYTTTTASVSSSPTSISHTMGGTTVSQPVVTLNFSAASSVTVVNITNNTTSQQIQYTGSISAGDVLVFDSEQKSVTKNGTPVFFSGSFPNAEVGINLFQVTVTGTSFACTATISAKATYL